jgi:hypothetical protein
MGDIDVTDPEYWRRRAREMRELCAITPDQETRRVFSNIASHYDELASMAERLAESLPMLAPSMRRQSH